MAEQIEVLTHSSIRITTEVGVVYVDPYQVRDTYHDAAFILVTHDHHDHFSPEDIAKVQKEDTVFIVPEKMAVKAEEIKTPQQKVYAVKQEGAYEIAGLSFETLPAYNILKPFHPKASGWVGYVIIANGKRIYIAGDTDLTKEAGKVKCDVALLPVGETFTMGAKKAAELANIIKPSLAIPTHYGSVVGDEAAAADFCKLVDASVQTEIIKQY